MSKYNQSFGRKGELVAEKFLQTKGYKIIERNYLKRMGEIDLITFDPHHKEYVFIEVKTRKSMKFGYPEESVTKTKINKIIQTAENWFDSNKIDNPEWRIDIISIDWRKKSPKIKHIENVS